MKGVKRYAAAAATAVVLISGQAMAASFADVVFIVDESGSMAGEHAWLGTMVGQLESALQAAGVGAGLDGNRYGLVGFGGSSGHAGGDLIDEHAVGGGQWGSSAQFATAAGTLTTGGGTEDGWAGINRFFSSYQTRAGAAVNVILVTDEDRDNTDNSLNYNGILSLFGQGALLNAVVNANFRDANQTSAIGIDSDDNAYYADGSGGYTVGGGATVTSAAGTTKANYIDLAWATGGAAWDLNILRSGGFGAQSFTNAFVDIKVQEIINQNPVPEPATMLLFGTGLAGLLGLKRRKKE